MHKFGKVCAHIYIHKIQVVSEELAIFSIWCLTDTFLLDHTPRSSGGEQIYTSRPEILPSAVNIFLHRPQLCCLKI